MVETSVILGLAMVLSFAVNIVVQITKGFIPIPTKLWCIIVAIVLNIGGLVGFASAGKIVINSALVIISVVGAFFTAFISMYGFDTLKDLWERFKKGEDINDK